MRIRRKVVMMVAFHKGVKLFGPQTSMASCRRRGVVGKERDGRKRLGLSGNGFVHQAGQKHGPDQIHHGVRRRVVGGVRVGACGGEWVGG